MPLQRNWFTSSSSLKDSVPSAEDSSYHHSRRQNWSAEKRREEGERRHFAKGLERSSRELLQNLNKMDNARRASKLFQHLLDWSRVLTFLPQHQLERVLPVVDQLANELMDMAPMDKKDHEPMNTSPRNATEALLVTVPIHGWAKLQSVQHYNFADKSHGKVTDAAFKAEALLHRLEEIYNQTGNTRYQPILESYGGVLDAFSKSFVKDAPERATALLERMSLDKNPLAKPDTRAYNIVLNAWATRGNPDQAQKLFQRMQSSGLSLDKYSYSTMTKAWLRSSRPERAEQVLLLLQQCIDQYEQDPKNNPMPNSMQFGTLIKLYEQEPHRAQEALDNLLDWYQRMGYHEDLQPQTRNFVPLMNAYAKRGQAEKVEELLLRLQQLYEAGNEKCKPNHKCFVVVINAWSKRRTLQAAQKAETILHRMEEIFLTGDDIRPEDQMNSYGYNLVMDAYVHSGSPDAVRHVQELFLRMERLGRQYNNERILPDKVTYTSVMRALIKEGKPGFEVGVEQLFQQMETAYKVEGRDRVKPDTITYACVLDALAKSGEAHAAERGEEILRKMIQLQEAGDPDVEASKVCFNSLLNIYSKQGMAAKAEQVLQWMEDSDAGKATEQVVSVKPDIVTYATCVDAWARSDASDGFQRALQIMEKMLERYQAGDEDCIPVTAIFCSLMTALAKSDEPTNKVEAALGLVEQTKEFGVVRTRIFYNTFLQACAATTGDDDIMEEALKHAVVTFQTMRSGKVGTDDITYKVMLHVFRNLIADEQERQRAFKDLFVKCCEDGYLDTHILHVLRNNLPIDVYTSIVGKDVVVPSALPVEWGRNYKG